MKCFIASAFEREDVDSIYENCVVPTLKNLSIKPLRVDRVEHNDDIDNKIIELLESSDIVIADLTYARPSVYYEAGYATGHGKPVVYIARSDHFRAKNDDPEGLLRVHFDLQMKNIIPWSKPNDAFSNRLENRLKHVLKPLINLRRINDKLSIERAEFRYQSERSKVNILIAKACSLLKARAFRLPEPESGRGIQSHALLAIREHNKISQQIAVICTPSAIKQIFEGIAMVGALGGFGPNRNIPVHFHYVVASLGSVPSSRVTQSLSSYRLLEDGVMHTKDIWEHRPETDIFVHVISGIQSQTEFANAFRSILARYDLEKIT
jgi:hypothetical protein